MAQEQKQGGIGREPGLPPQIQGKQSKEDIFFSYSAPLLAGEQMRPNRQVLMGRPILSIRKLRRHDTNWLPAKLLCSTPARVHHAAGLQCSSLRRCPANGLRSPPRQCASSVVARWSRRTSTDTRLMAPQSCVRPSNLRSGDARRSLHLRRVRQRLSPLNKPASSA